MNAFIEVLSVIGFGLAIITVIYLFVLFARKKKAGHLLLLAIIVACVALPLRLLVIDIPNAIPEGHYHIPCDFESKETISEVKTTVDLYTFFNAKKQKFRIIEIKGVRGNSVSGDYYFRGDEKLVISVKSFGGNAHNATLTIPEVNAHTLGISFIDSWYALSDTLNAFYISWAVIDALLILMFIILQTRSVEMHNETRTSEKVSIPTRNKSINGHSPLLNEDVEKQIVCKNCGAIISSKDNYCKFCGMKIVHTLAEMSKEELLEYIQKLKEDNNSIEAGCSSIEDNVSESQHDNQPVTNTSISEGTKKSELRVSVVLKDGSLIWVPISALDALRKAGKLK